MIILTSTINKNTCFFTLTCYNIYMNNIHKQKYSLNNNSNKENITTNNENRYNKLKPFLINKFGEKVGKICIDGNFTCPNRDGKYSKGGCIFCSSKGSR